MNVVSHWRRISFAIAAGMAAAAAGPAHALPVIPGAAGFGIDTPAGRGGPVYRVTNLLESGAGSLKACIDATGPRTCVFEVSGVIRLTEDMTIRNGKLTIAGQTAPSPGIMIRGGALKVHASDILIQHLRFRIGDDPVGPDPARARATPDLSSRPRDHHAPSVHRAHQGRPLGDGEPGHPPG